MCNERAIAVRLLREKWLVHKSVELFNCQLNGWLRKKNTIGQMKFNAIRLFEVLRVGDMFEWKIYER